MIEPNAEGGKHYFFRNRLKCRIKLLFLLYSNGVDRNKDTQLLDIIWRWPCHPRCRLWTSLSGHPYAPRTSECYLRWLHGQIGRSLIRNCTSFKSCQQVLVRAFKRSHSPKIFQTLVFLIIFIIARIRFGECKRKESANTVNIRQHSANFRVAWCKHRVAEWMNFNTESNPQDYTEMYWVPTKIFTPTTSHDSDVWSLGSVSDFGTAVKTSWVPWYSNPAVFFQQLSVKALASQF